MMRERDARRRPIGTVGDLRPHDGVDRVSGGQPDGFVKHLAASVAVSTLVWVLTKMPTAANSEVAPHR